MSFIRVIFKYLFLFFAFLNIFVYLVNWTLNIFIIYKLTQFFLLSRCILPNAAKVTLRRFMKFACLARYLVYLPGAYWFTWCTLIYLIHIILRGQIFLKPDVQFFFLVHLSLAGAYMFSWFQVHLNWCISVCQMHIRLPGAYLWTLSECRLRW